MTENLSKARSLLDAGGYTCVACRDGLVHTTTERGVKPLLNWLDSGLSLKGFSAADRVVGRATAFLYCLLGVEAVYARVMSHPAAEVLKAHGVAADTDTLVDGIINRKGTGPCPFEAAVMEIQDAGQALEAIRRQMARMQAGAGDAGQAREWQTDIHLEDVSEKHSQFLYVLMNDPSILAALNEIPTQTADWTEAISAWKCDPDEVDYIIYDRDTPIGWLGINGLMSEEKTAYLKLLALLPAYQGKGIGTYAVRQAIKLVKNRGFSEIALHTNQCNQKAQACYLKCGFEVAQVYTEEMSNGDIVQRFKMTLDLT